jgi:hypothetical protein
MLLKPYGNLPISVIADSIFESTFLPNRILLLSFKVKGIGVGGRE